MSHRQSAVVDSKAGARIAVRVTPRAKRSGLAGLVHGADGAPSLAVRLNAPPVDGAANKALLSFLAERLGVPRSSLAIVSGAAARTKVVEVAGVGAAEVTSRLETGSD